MNTKSSGPNLQKTLGDELNELELFFPAEVFACREKMRSDQTKFLAEFLGREFPETSSQA
ncbi:hypothetical protein ACMSSJ_11425 [Kerstersia gyiorum]|uniref:hypothetical protein n=1 Tax=Kerstersia gyiorum TaxID=206506 RepID=UPI0039E76D83